MICQECHSKDFTILGTCLCGIIVECDSCGAEYNIEPDGLGQGGLEWVTAKMIDMEEERIDE